MKFKTLSLLAVAVVVTLSFTFASVQQNKAVKEVKVENTSTSAAVDNAPAGGFALEDKL
jgi:uncharacterized membrane protein YjfL (UPF0719 family)